MTPKPESVPAVWMRGGTSKALFFHEKHVPPLGTDRDRFLMRIMGSPDPMQIDGMGGTYPVTSKIAIIRPSEREDADVDFIFVQVSVNEKFVDYDAGLAIPHKKSASINLCLRRKSWLPINPNTGRFLEKGEYMIAGCPGSGSPILMDYRYTIGGGVDRGLLPTGRPIDSMDLDGNSIQHTICDAAHIIAFAYASDFGLKGDEHPKAINENQEVLAKVRRFRGQAAFKVGMCSHPSTVDQESPILPMVALLSPASDAEAHIQSRLFLDNACHSAMAGAGATCTAAASRIKGSLVADIMKPKALKEGVFNVQHPSGILPITISTGPSDDEDLPTFETLSFVRTARYLMKGELFVPEDLDVSF
ncbi:3-methylitaconate isomerase [Pseudocercospora fuligena]|uniref:3-methylitaconate isomerase n=1 Tax=Pseudocercospora fuligena TaxID=685502 RepID=A0A8H6R5K3_9PEZI|nr:3-methylitaconate isomerase [Pseudocercospora fuligena]